MVSMILNITVILYGKLEILLGSLLKHTYSYNNSTSQIYSHFLFSVVFCFFFLLPLLPSSFLPSPRFIKTLLRCKVLRKKFSKRKLYLSLRLTLKQLILCLKEKTTKKKKNFFSTKTCFICIFFFLIFSATLLIRTLL